MSRYTDLERRVEELEAASARQAQLTVKLADTNAKQSRLLLKMSERLDELGGFRAELPL